MKNLVDCINENWTDIDNKPAFVFTKPDKEFDGYNGPLNGDYAYDNANELMRFFEGFLICYAKEIKSTLAAIDGMSGLVKGFENASKYAKDKNYKKAYKKMSLAVAEAQSDLKEAYIRSNRYANDI